MMRIEFQGLTPLIQVFDMSASIHFYRDVLGFEIVTASGPVPDCGWALLRRNRDEMMLNTQFEVDCRPAVPDVTRQQAHSDSCFYFGCHDLDAAYAHLQANNVAAQKPTVAPYGMRQLYFSDPDGFKLCFSIPRAKTPSSSDTRGTGRITVEGQSQDQQAQNPFVNLQGISPEYLDVMRVPLHRGRTFTLHDTLASPWDDPFVSMGQLNVALDSIEQLVHKYYLAIMRQELKSSEREQDPAWLRSFEVAWYKPRKRQRRSSAS